MTTKDQAPIQLDGVSAGYGGTTVLNDVSLTCGTGITVIVGANGSGKSTLLGLLATLRTPTTGRVTIAGADLATANGVRRARRAVGYLPQEPSFPDAFTVGELVRYGAWLNRVPRLQATAATTRALDAVDLGSQAQVALKALSGGQRHRAFLAQALVHQPPVLLLDEPTTAIDIAQLAEFRTHLRAVAHDRCVVLTSHVIDDVRRLADRVVVIARGTVAFAGSPDELRRHGSTEEGAAVGRDLEGATERAVRVLSDPS